MYILDLSKIAISGRNVVSGQTIDFGLKMAEVSDLIENKAIISYRPTLYLDSFHPYYTVLAGVFIPGTNDLFIMAHEEESSMLVFFLYTANGDGIEMGFLDNVQELGQNNRCCVVGDTVYAISNKQEILYAVNLKDNSYFVQKFNGKHFIDVRDFKDGLISLVWNSDSNLYELLDDNFTVLSTDKHYSALAANDQALAISRGETVYLFE